jgi:hypothetical protein
VEDNTTLEMILDLLHLRVLRKTRFWNRGVIEKLGKCNGVCTSCFYLISVLALLLVKVHFFVPMTAQGGVLYTKKPYAQSCDNENK